MRLDLTVVALILLSALLHASWNAIVKAEGDRLIGFAIVQGTGLVLALIALPFVEVPVAAAWPYLLLSVCIHYCYYYTLLSAYAHGDLSHVYPIARGLGPLLVAMSSSVLIGEHLSAKEYSGVALVCVGIASVALAKGMPRAADARATGFALMTGMTIAGYTIVDGLGVRASQSSLGYIAWLNLLEGIGPALVAFALRGPIALRQARPIWRRSVGGGIIASIGYGLAIWALGQGAMAHVAALRETSVLFAALIGTWLLREPFGRVRMIAAAFVVSGLLLMNLRW